MYVLSLSLEKYREAYGQFPITANRWFVPHEMPTNCPTWARCGKGDKNSPGFIPGVYPDFIPMNLPTAPDGSVVDMWGNYIYRSTGTDFMILTDFVEIIDETIIHSGAFDRASYHAGPMAIYTEGAASW